MEQADDIDGPASVRHSQAETSKQIDDLMKFAASKTHRKGLLLKCSVVLHSHSSKSLGCQRNAEY
eukprot:749980-Hanusia_phi.AAC.3